MTARAARLRFGEAGARPSPRLCGASVGLIFVETTPTPRYSGTSHGAALPRPHSRPQPPVEGWHPKPPQTTQNHEEPRFMVLSGSAWLVPPWRLATLSARAQGVRWASWRISSAQLALAGVHSSVLSAETRRTTENHVEPRTVVLAGSVWFCVVGGQCAAAGAAQTPQFVQARTEAGALVSDIVRACGL